MITVRVGQLIRFKDRKKFPNGEIYLVLERCPLPERCRWERDDSGALKILMGWKVLGPKSNYEYVHDSFLKNMEVVKS